MHIFQAGEDHHTVGQTALHEEMEGVPAKRNTVNLAFFSFSLHGVLFWSNGCRHILYVETFSCFVII